MPSKPDKPRVHLYDLPLLYQELEEELDAADGELSPELEAKFNALDGTLEDKHDNICRLMAHFAAREESLKPELERLTKRKRASANAHDRLRAYLFDVMVKLGKQKIETTFFTSAVQKNGGKPKVEYEGDIETLHMTHPGYCNMVPESYEINKDRLIEAWKARLPIPDGVKVSQGTHLALR